MMTDSKKVSSTPGPWRWWFQTQDWLDDASPFALQAAGGNVTIFEAGNGSLVSPMEADAALIAAAPDMLAALIEIAKGSPPDDWEYFDYAWGEYVGYGKRDDPDYVDSVDVSNSGDVHKHGFDVGRWSAAKIARAAIAKARGNNGR